MFSVFRDIQLEIRYAATGIEPFNPITDQFQISLNLFITNSRMKDMRIKTRVTTTPEYTEFMDESELKFGVDLLVERKV